jgi:hypothetical protein
MSLHNNFDPTNPQHVGQVMQELYQQITKLEQSEKLQADQNADLSSQINQLRAQSSGNQLASPSRPHAALKLPLPEKYDGKRHLFRQFINSIKLHFSVSSDQFQNDVAKTAFVASLLRGSALDWITPYLEQQDPILSSWTDFESRFKAMFDDPHRAKTAVTKLTQLFQGRRPVVAYAAEFRRIIMDADFDNNAQVYWFRVGLSDPILDELTHTSAETELDKFIAPCVLIDTRLREREVERTRRSRAMLPSSSRFSNSSAPDAMEIDSASTSTRHGPISADERKRRLENDICLFFADALAIVRLPAHRSRETGRPVGREVDGQSFR